MGRLVQLFILMAVVFAIQTAQIDASNLRWIWASYGQVPAYAVAGGSDYPGQVLYVARFYLWGKGFLPGKMEVSSNKAHASWGGKEYYSSHYQILTNPRWRSHLEWKASSGSYPPANAMVGGKDRGRPVYVARALYSDGHMIPGKAAYFYRTVYIPYGGKEYEKPNWYVLVEHTRSGRKRDIPSRFEYPDLPGVKPLKRAPIRHL